MQTVAKNTAFTSNSTAVATFTISRPIAPIAIYTTPTRAGTVLVQVADANGTYHSLGSAVAVSANAQDIQVVNFAHPQIKVTYTNNDSNAGTCLIEYQDNGGM